MKPRLRFTAGWLLMFSGTAAMLDAPVRWQSAAAARVHGRTFAGCAMCLAGWFFRRSALRSAPLRLKLL